MGDKRFPAGAEVYAPWLVAGALAVHWWALWPYTARSGYDFDATYLYLPLAREWLEHGLTFFRQEQSLQAPPLSYIYPAIVGLDLAHLKTVNALVSGATLLLAARTAQLGHSTAAGVATAWLFALSPLLRPFLATPVTEPPYLFLCAAWAWSLFEWLAGGRTIFVFVSALAIVMAALMRATMFYWAVALALIYGVLWWRGGGLAPRARAATIAYALALTIPAAFIAKNVVLFGFPFYATGAGNALYLGNNPLTGGYDPPLLGLMFDVGSIARDQSHLTLEAERLLGGVARYIIAHESFTSLIALHVQKLGAFLFVTSAEGGARALRAWRIALLIIGTIGVTQLRGRAMRWALAGMVVYQIAVHVPVLYTHRYSVGALDLWLVILAGVGVASLLPWERRYKLLAASVTVFACAQVGRAAMEQGDPPAPHVFDAARILMWETPPFEYAAGASGAPMEFEVRHRSIAFDKAMNFVLVIDAEAPEARAQCSHLHITYRRHGDAVGRTIERIVRAGGSAQRLQIGGKLLDLDSEGVLSLAMQCRSATRVRFQRLAVYAPVGSIDFRERYLGEKQLYPGLMER